MTPLRRGSSGREKASYRASPRGLKPAARVSCHPRGVRLLRRRGYVLLETVVALGLLLFGLTVIGTQVQESYGAIHKIRLRLEAMQLAESQLAMLDLGLIELDSADEVQEENFGPRYPHFAWRLTINETADQALFLLQIDILYKLREDPEETFDEDDFDFDNAKTVYTLYAMRPGPPQLDLASEFGLTEKEVEELSEKLEALGVEGLSTEAFDPSILAKLDFEELIEVLPSLLDAFGIKLDDIIGSLPPEALEALQESGLLDSVGERGAGGEGDGAAVGRGP